MHPGLGVSDIRTVIVCAGQPLVRAGIRRTLELEYGIGVAGEATSGDDAAGLMLKHAAAIVLIEDGLYDDETLSRHPAGVVVIAETLDADRLLRLVDGGVRAIVCRYGPRYDLVRAVHSVAAGGGFIAPEFASSVIAAIRANAPAPQLRRRRPRLAGLTVRERAVLDVVCKGMTNREIAGVLKLSEKTVKFHVSNVLAKMEVRSRAQLIANVAGVLPGTQ